MSCIGVLRLSIVLHGVNSLKEKRSIIQTLLRKISNQTRFCCSETAYQDSHQQTQIDIVTIGADKHSIQSKIDSSISLCESVILSYGFLTKYHTEFIQLSQYAE